nr:hypothetical protein [Tanacetum cinerariifolium]
MVADLRYFNSLESEVDSLTSQLETQKTQFVSEIDHLSMEYFYADHMNAILGVYTELDEVTNMQCDYLELLQKCKCIETELSKSKKMSTSFESVQKHAINLELELQQCKEKVKNDMSFKVNKSKDFCKEREQYFEIQDLKAQLQDKSIAISELKKLIEMLKGKSVDTKVEKSSVIRQPNAFKSPRPSVLGKPTTFSNSFIRKDFSKSTSVIRLEKESRSKLSDLVRPFDYAKLNSLYDLFVPQREKSSEQRFFLELSRISHINAQKEKKKESFQKQTIFLETQMNESISENKKCQSIFEIENIQRDINTIVTGVELCKQKIANPTWYGHVEPVVKNTIEQNFCPVISKINVGLHMFLKRLNEEMVADLRYFNSLESEVDSHTSQLETQKTQFVNEIDRLSREYFYADHMNAILGVYTELDEVTNLQCDYLELLQKCECLENELSKSKKMSKSFKAL